jgi:hypothetical protein
MNVTGYFSRDFLIEKVRNQTRIFYSRRVFDIVMDGLRGLGDVSPLEISRRMKYDIHDLILYSRL